MTDEMMRNRPAAEEDRCSLCTTLWRMIPDLWTLCGSPPWCVYTQNSTETYTTGEESSETSLHCIELLIGSYTCLSTEAFLADNNIKAAAQDNDQEISCHDKISSAWRR